MKTATFYTSIVLLGLFATATGFAKDKKKDDDKNRSRVVIVDKDRDGRDRHDDHDHDRDRDRDRDGRYRDGRYRDYRGDHQRDRTRTIYVIERGRPVQRVVYIGSDGRYYSMVQGRRSYVSSRYYESYPSKYYYPDGRRRVTITLPF
jgi:hypothetical protein